MTVSDRQNKNGMSYQQIIEHLPHRYPFLLVDRVEDLEPNDFIIAYKMVSAMEPCLQGHFPGNPVMPGVLMIEAMAQASAILGKVTKGDGAQGCLLTEVTESRFRRVVVPGDSMRIDVRLVKARQHFFWFQGEVTVDGDLAAIAKFTAKLA